MRREHNKAEQSYIGWLKSLGCVFYAPLDQEHGMTDLISGVTGTVPPANTNCSITWDNTLQMYVIDNQCPYYAGLWWDGLNMFPNAVNGSTLMRNVAKTMLFTVRFITDPAYNYCNSVIGIGGGDNGQTYNVSTGSSRQLAEYLAPYMQVGLRAGTTAKIGLVRDGLKIWLLYDGAWYSQNNNDTWNQVYYTRFGQRMCIANISNGNGSRTHIAGKDAYVFNTALDLATIRKIQGYE